MLSSLYITLLYEKSPSISFENGWVISKTKDISVFIGVSIIALLVPLLFNVTPQIRYSLYIVLFYDGIMTFGHSFATFYPLVFVTKNKHITIAGYNLLVILCVLGSVLFFNFHHSLFLATVSLSLMWHYIRQKVGWVHLCSKKVYGTKRFTDEMMVYNVCLIPLLIYLSNPELSNKMILSPKDLNIAQIPYFLNSPLLIFFWVFNCYYIFDQIKWITKTKSINTAKYVIILSGVLCFCIPYIMLPETFQYWIPSLFVHAISYILFTYSFSKNHKILKQEVQQTAKPPLYHLPLKNLFIYTFVLLVLGLIVSGMFYSGFRTNSLSYMFFVPFAYSFFFIHFITDAFVWKARFMKAPV